MSILNAYRPRQIAGAGRGRKVARATAVASALVVGVAAPAFATDIGSVLGGVLGGMIGAAQRPQYYQPAPQYYQPPPTQYYQQQQQPQYYHNYQDSAAARRRAHEAELRRQKAAQERAAQEKAEKEKAAQEAAVQAAPVAVGADGAIDVAMKRDGGNLWVPAEINGVVKINFVIDSGASDITLPRDVYLTLIRSGTLTKTNYIGNVNFDIADGSQVKGAKFKLNSLKVGNQILNDVVASVMPSDSATPLLGLSFLSRFQSWAIDNGSGTLKLTPIGAVKTATAPPTQVAAAKTDAQSLPDLRTIEPGTPQVPAAPTAALSAAQPAQLAQSAQAAPAAAPEPKVAAAAPDAPRSGHVSSSALIAKEATAPATPVSVDTAPVAKPAAVGAVVPVFPPNTSYTSARSSLLALGYGPAPLPDAGKCDSTTDATCFPERATCAKTDSVQCDFLWRRGNELIKVKTVAVPPTVSAVECQVNCK